VQHSSGAQSRAGPAGRMLGYGHCGSKEALQCPAVTRPFLGLSGRSALCDDGAVTRCACWSSHSVKNVSEEWSNEVQLSSLRYIALASVDSGVIECRSGNLIKVSSMAITRLCRHCPMLIKVLVSTFKSDSLLEARGLTFIKCEIKRYKCALLIEKITSLFIVYI